MLSTNPVWLAIAAAAIVASTGSAAPRPSTARASLDEWRRDVAGGVAQLQADHFFKDGAMVAVSGSHALVAPLGSGRARANSILQIGSVTKSFTGIILAELILESQATASPVKPGDRVEKYLPELLGSFSGGITLAQLATHTSGLPRLPSDIDATAADPYARYGAAKLLAFLREFKPDGYDPSAPRPAYPYLYSNTGFALLGYIEMAVTRAPSFDALVAARIAGPLGMPDTRVDLSDEQKSRLVPGYDVALVEMPDWTWDVFAPTGGLHSSPSDMLKYLRANVHPDGSLLGRAMQLSQQDGFGWDSEPGAAVIWKNGMTASAYCQLDFSVATGNGLLIMANVAFSGISDLFATVAGTPVKSRQGVPLSAAQVGAVVGAYASSALGAKLAVEQGDGFLFADDGTGRVRLEPTGPADFIVIDAVSAASSVSFQVPSGQALAQGLVYHLKDPETGAAIGDYPFQRRP